MHELISEYKRDMYHNYFVIQKSKECQGDYFEKIQKYNQLQGLLNYEERQINNNRYSYYKVDGLQTLSCVYEKKTIGNDELIKIVTDLIKSINQGRLYLLKETDYILSENHIFLEMPECEVFLCYFPGYGVPLKQQFQSLFEFIMNHVDYNDQVAVYLIYRLYIKSKEEDCTLQNFKAIIAEPVKGASGEQLKSSDFIEKLRRDNSIQLPFIEQKNEDEQEILYYPVRNFVIAGAAFVMALVSMGIINRFRMLFGKTGRILESKTMMFVGLMLAAVVAHIVYRLFRAGAKQSRMIPRIAYITPEQGEHLGFLEDINGRNINTSETSVKDDIVEIRAKGRATETGVKDGNLETSIKDRSIETSAKDGLMEDETKTMVLTEYFNSQKRYPELCPNDRESYERITLNEFPFFIGKLKSRMDYGLDHAAVSRFHAKITKEDEEYFIYDLNSTNGTFLNGKQLNAREKTTIHDGDEIQFADVIYHFVCI